MRRGSALWPRTWIWEMGAGTAMPGTATGRTAGVRGRGDGRWRGGAGDVTRADDVRRVVGEITEALGPVDVLVHVVGGWLGGVAAGGPPPAGAAAPPRQPALDPLG